MFKKDYPTGTILKCSIKRLPFVYHYGIVLNEGNRILKIVHNAPKKNKYGGGINVDRIEDFLKSRTIDEIKFSKLTRGKIVSSVNKYVKVPFNLFYWNCEHYVTKVETGHAQSPQIRSAARNAAYLIVIILALTKNPLKMKKNTLIVLLAILVLTVGSYYTFKAIKKQNEQLPGTTPPTNTRPPVVSNPEPEPIVIEDPGIIAQGGFFDSDSNTVLQTQNQ